MPAIQSLVDANVRSRTFFVASTQVLCRYCASSTRLLALAMPHDHETLDTDTPIAAGENGGPAADSWWRADANAFLFYVERLPDDVRDRLHQLSPSFRLAYSAATLNSYWANHCEHCGMLLDDHELHCEPDGAFVPSNEDAATKIHLVQIREPFEALAAGYAFEPEFFRFMRKS
jgi:hypothetical protein